MARPAATPAQPRLARLASRALSSPVAVAASLSICVGSWSLAYRSRADDPVAAERRRPAVEQAASQVPIPPSRPEARPDPTSLPRPVPRLRAPYSAGAVPGLEIALQDADGRSMSRFHAALDRARSGEGQARLLFYGASHTAADIYTGYLRHALQSAFGDAGHGFVLPVQPWRGYSHVGIRIARMSADWTTIKVGTGQVVEDHYGVAGVAVESSTRDATAFVETERGDGLGSRASKFEVYYLMQPGGGSFDVFVDGQRQERVSTRGATKQAGYYEVRTTDASHRVELKVVGDGVVRLFGVAVERDEPGVIVDVHGINGSRARSHLYWEETLYREHLRKRRADLVVLAYGTNESGDDNQPIATYEEQLRRVVARVREATPNASCLLIGPSDRPVATADGQWVDRPRTAQIIEAQWRVALESGCAFFDVVAFQGGSMATVSWAGMEPAYAGRDHVHFTRRGYERMGQVLLGALLEGTSFTLPAAGDFIASEPEGQ